MPSPIKTVVQLGQYPVQGSASLVSSGSPSKPATDPASIKSLASAYTSRTSPLHSIPNGSVPSAHIPAPASPKTQYNMYNSNLPFKTTLGSTTDNLSSVKSISSLSSLKTAVDSTLSSIGGRSSLSSLSSTGQTTIASSELSMMNGSASPVKYPSSSTPSSPSSRHLSERSSSLQERIQATTQAATSSVSAAINEAIDSYSVSGYGTLRSLSSSRRTATASSAYGSLRSGAASSGTPVSSNTMTVPVYSLVNVIPETPVKPGPGSLKMALPDSPRASSSSSSSLSSCVTASKINSQMKSPPFITPAIIHPTATSNQEILKDVADMKEDLMRMTAILQTDTQTAAKTVQTSRTGTPKEAKLEDEEPYTLVEKVKEDLVKVSEILQKDIRSEGKAGKERASEDEWEEFTKDEIEEAQRSALSDYYPPFDEHTLLLKHQSMSSKDLELAEVVDFLTNNIGASSLSKMAELKCRYEEEAKREGEEKQKRVLKPSMTIQEHKLKMPPPVSGMLRSPSEKDLSKLAESYQGTDTILESPEDLSHEQDKSPLSDSGFETRSEKTPSAPQSAESTGPKPLFTDSPIPPCVTETRTEVVHIRSYEQPDDPCEPVHMEDAASAIPSLEPDAASSSSMKALQMKMPEDDSMMNKSVCLKEETHITTTTRMVYHKPQLTDGAEMIDEGMSVRDIMKAFQSGRDPSKELAGLFEHKASQDSVKGDELTPRFLDRDIKSKPKVERIIEVHIEKGHSTAEPTEVIIRETKKHPELYVYKGDHGN
ncbi:Ankyrin-3 [Larimichthys crocea]|uniref:Ankyrin-3 n=1 Tax=Larimichthys crocea TaxID=215358 RepID=A0A6G0HXY9_LARCR|nr:Ankyrin-3 [Larimichthys crocea]